MKSKEELEKRAEVVCQQLELMKRGSDPRAVYDLGEKFLPQTPAEIKYYGKLMHLVNRADYVDTLNGDEIIEIVPAKAGFYQFSKQEGLFNTRDNVWLYEEYRKAQDDTYKEYTELRAKY